MILRSIVVDEDNSLAGRGNKILPSTAMGWIERKEDEKEKKK